MIDTFGRKVSYLRLSVTDRCDLRCVYCMAEDMTFLPKADVLSLEELERLARVFAYMGVRKIRLTGGEPLVRRDVMTLITNLGAMVRAGRLDELTLTTNGTQLARHAAALKQAGIRRINVSLDTLDPAKFATVTRWGRFEQVMDGIRAAKAAGLAVKINTVAMQGVNDDEIEAMAAWCGGEGFDLTFIETMPLGEVADDRSDHYLPLAEVKGLLAARYTLTETDYSTGGPSRYVSVAETGRRIGFISPISHSFCESCNRVRVTCTGSLYTCLGHEGAHDLRSALRSEGGDAALADAIRAAVGTKPKGHDFVISRGAAPATQRHMSATGG